MFEGLTISEARQLARSSCNWYERWLLSRWLDTLEDPTAPTLHREDRRRSERIIARMLRERGVYVRAGAK